MQSSPPSKIAKYCLHTFQRILSTQKNCGKLFLKKSFNKILFFLLEIETYIYAVGK